MQETVRLFGPTDRVVRKAADDTVLPRGGGSDHFFSVACQERNIGLLLCMVYPTWTASIERDDTRFSTSALVHRLEPGIIRHCHRGVIKAKPAKAGKQSHALYPWKG